MAQPGKLIYVCTVLICCLLENALAEKWRAVAKMVRHCDGPKLAIEYHDLKIGYKNRGEMFRVISDVEFFKNVTFSTVHVDVFRSGGSSMVKVLTWTFTDFCSIIMKGHEYINPVFGPKGLPRQCTFTAGNYTMTTDYYDITGQTIGFSLRGEYMGEVKAYDEQELVFCFTVYGVIK